MSYLPNQNQNQARPSRVAANVPRGAEIIGYIVIALFVEALLLRGAPRVIVPVAESAGIHTKCTEARLRPTKVVRTVVAAVTGKSNWLDA